MKRAVFVLLLLAGCYRTRFEMQPPVGYGTPSPLYNGHFHFSVVNVVEVSAPVDLGAACAGERPAAIDEQVGVIAAVVNTILVYFPVIHLHNATVLCPLHQTLHP